MHQLFIDWYRQVNISPNLQILESHWKTIENLADEIEINILLDLVIFFNEGDCSEEIKDYLNNSFRANDPTFPTVDNLFELRVLVGALLIHLLSTEHHTANLVALSIHCSRFNRRFNFLKLPDVFKYCDKYLIDEAVKVRKLAEMELKIFNDFKVEGITDPNTLIKSLKSLTTSITSMFNKVKMENQILAEESNILWWLINEFSRFLNQPWSKLKNKGNALFLAKDLSDITFIIPGPISIYSLLEKANNRFSKKNTITIKEAVNSLPKNQKEYLSIESEMISKKYLIFPLLTAIHKSLETGEENAWVATFNNLTKRDASESVSMVSVSYEFYQECLLLRELKAYLD